MAAVSRTYNIYFPFLTLLYRHDIIPKAFLMIFMVIQTLSMTVRCVRHHIKIDI
jgi:hypothetical protein